MTLEMERQSMPVDIVCVGCGPATGGFLSTLAKTLAAEPPGENGEMTFSSQAAPGMPLQVVCYERADDLAFGVSGVVTRGRGIRQSFPDLKWEEIPNATEVSEEKLVYLLDPIGASRRNLLLRLGDAALRALKPILPFKHDALELPYIPSFMRKHGGAVMSIGQFNQWVGMQAMSSGMVQIWPSSPVSEPLIEDHRVVGVRLVDQGTNKAGEPESSYMPGLDVHAALTVVGDGPVGAIGQRLDEHFGMPAGHSKEEWAVGMKLVVNLPEDTELKPGMVFHTFGFPEPEIFGFMYVYPNNIASLGIFVPSWLGSPARTAYRYLQHWMLHPYLWQHLKGSTLHSWGAKSLQESGKRGEPFLCGNGYARIGEGSGSTNVLTGSGVDEAWTTGVQLAEAVIELLRAKKPFTRENLEETYVKRRRESWVEAQGLIAERARDGFHFGMIPGMLGMALSGFTRGLINLPGRQLTTAERIQSYESYFAGRIPPDELETIRLRSRELRIPLHDAIMDRLGWPQIPFDGQLLISQQDALLIGGKVQAQSGYADHVQFIKPELCETCNTKVCVEMCSGQAIALAEGNVLAFDREKCVHCGACIWNCATRADNGHTNIRFGAGSGGLHSVEN